MPASQHSCADDLDRELASRANPEKSRLFDRDKLIASLGHLMRATENWPRSGQRITVVGSNGKGSTSFALAGLAADSTGLYTSPHLQNVCERIRLGGIPVDPCVLLEALHDVKELVGSAYQNFSYFELLTLAAANIFERRSCALQIYEAGLGGRFDAVHIARSETVVLAAVSLEHTHILGKTLREIAQEKLAILTWTTRRLIVMPQDSSKGQLPIEFIVNEARSHNPSIDVIEYQESLGAGQPYTDYNSGFARFVLDQCGLPVKHAAGFSAPGRLEEHLSPGGAAPRVRFLYDSGHNPEAIWRVLRYLKERGEAPYPPDQTVLILGVLRDRSAEECLAGAYSLGYSNVWVIDTDFLARVPATARPVRPRELGRLASQAARLGTQGFVMLGSHYIYNFFLEMKDSYGKTGPQVDDVSQLQ